MPRVRAFQGKGRGSVLIAIQRTGLAESFFKEFTEVMVFQPWRN
jgi:hypothetical protein